MINDVAGTITSFIIARGCGKSDYDLLKRGCVFMEAGVEPVTCYLFPIGRNWHQAIGLIVSSNSERSTWRFVVDQ